MELDGDLADLGVDELLEALLSDGEGAFNAVMAAPGDDADERAFELADVGADVGRDEEGDVGGQRGVLGLGFALEDGDLGFKVGWLDVGDEAPLEARAEAVFDVAELLGGAVGGEDDLLRFLVEGVEGVEELFLHALLAGEELHVVDEQDVDRAELVAEGGHFVVAEGVDELVDELFARDVADGGVGESAFRLVADGVHEVGLAHADAAVEEERIVGLRGALGDGHGGGHGELVSAAGDEAVELIARVELGGGVPIEAGLLGGGSGRSREARNRAVAPGAVRSVAVGARGAGGVAGLGGKPAVFPNTRDRGILRGSFELDGVDLKPKALDGFFDQVGIFVADVLKLGRRNLDVQGSVDEAGEAGWLQPRFKGLPVDLLFKRTEDADPLIERSVGRRNK